MSRLATGMAILGGVVLSLIVVLVCLSVIGRVLNDMFHGILGDLMPGISQWALDRGVGPINGDFELVEAGVAFAIFAFLPLCQITSGHASVDIFTAKLGSRANRLLRMVTDIVFAVVLIIIAVQLYAGMASKMRYGETTFLLQFPIWWAYAASLSGAVVAAVIGVYMALVRCAEFLSGRALIPEVDTEGAAH